MNNLYNQARNLVLRAISYKFRVRSQIYEILTGNSGGPHQTARDISQFVIESYSGKITGQNIKGLEQSIERARLV